MVEYVQHLDQVLANLERAGVTLSRAKSQFFQVGIKIVGYICDAAGYHLDTSKVLKILDWPKCTDITSVRAFLGVCVYFWIWIKNFAQVPSFIYHVLKKNTPFIWGKEQVDAMDLLKLAYTTPPALVYLDYSEGAGENYTCGGHKSRGVRKGASVASSGKKTSFKV